MRKGGRRTPWGQSAAHSAGEGAGEGASGLTATAAAAAAAAAAAFSASRSALVLILSPASFRRQEGAAGLAAVEEKEEAEEDDDEPAPPPAPLKALTPKLAYSLQELSEELGISRVSFYRLEAKGILKPLPHLRHKIYSREEVSRFLSGIGGEIRPDERPRRGRGPK